MLDGQSDRFWDLFDRSRSKIGLILLGFMVMVPLGLFGIEGWGDSPDGLRLYPISGSSEAEQDEGSDGFDGASDFGLNGGSSEKSPSGPSKRRTGNGETSTGDGTATDHQSSVVENDVTTLGPERIEPLGTDDSTLESSEVDSTAGPVTTKRTVTTQRKAETTTTLRRSTTVTRRQTTTTKRRTTTTKRQTTTTQDDDEPSAAVVVGTEPTLGPPDPNDETPSIDTLVP